MRKGTGEILSSFLSGKRKKGIARAKRGTKVDHRGDCSSPIFSEHPLSSPKATRRYGTCREGDFNTARPLLRKEENLEVLLTKRTKKESHPEHFHASGRPNLRGRSFVFSPVSRALNNLPQKKEFAATVSSSLPFFRNTGTKAEWTSFKAKSKKKNGKRFLKSHPYHKEVRVFLGGMKPTLKPHAHPRNTTSKNISKRVVLEGSDSQKKGFIPRGGVRLQPKRAAGGWLSGSAKRKATGGSHLTRKGIPVQVSCPAAAACETNYKALV